MLAQTKTRRRHSVDLDPGTLAELRSHACRAANANGGRLPDGLVFSDDVDGSTAWKPNHVTKTFVRSRRAAGLREFRLHDLRHFMATEIDAEVPLPVVARRLDHRRVSTTLDRYAHAVPGRDREAATDLWRLVRSAAPIR